MKKEIYQEAVEKIVQAIKSGVKPWRAPFDRPTLKRAENFLTKAKYKGANSVLLYVEAYLKGYSNNNWLTYKQISELKGKVKKGESAARVFFFTYVKKDEVEVDGKKGESEKIEIKAPRWKYFNVFNLDQTEGLVEPEPIKEISDSNFINNVTVDNLVASSKATIKHSDRKAAFYHPGDDFIHLPMQEHFRSVEGYYATLLHELVHWTGHKVRLDRLKASSRFGNKFYAFEELVAELGSMFLSIDLNVNSDVENHASYLDDWADLLNDKHMAFFKAAALAEKATQYLYDLAQLKSDKQFALFDAAA